MFRYAIVEFFGDNCIKREVDIVCMSWLVGDGTKTLWPPKDVVYKQKKAVDPGTDWQEFSIRVIDRAVNYEEARKMLKKSEFTSDVRSEVDDPDIRHKRKVTNRLADMPSSDSDSANSMSLIKYVEPPKSFFKKKKTRPNGVSSNSEPNRVLSNSGLLSNSGPSEVLWNSRPVTLADFSAFQEVVFNKIEEIKEIGVQNNKLLKQLLHSSAVPISMEDMPPTMPKIPLMSTSEVSDLETWLAVDENKQYLVNYLSAIGGKDIPDITRSIMAAVFGKRIATEYNWVGQRGKLSFQELKLKDVVFGSVLKATNGKDFSFMVVAQAIKSWLKAARYRMETITKKKF